MSTVSSPNIGDQGFLNNYFPNWYSLPREHHLDFSYNVMIRASGTSSFDHFVGENAKVLHYSGWKKPWNGVQDAMVWITLFFSTHKKMFSLSIG